MAVFRVIMTKRGTWRGQNEEWSNGYFFDGEVAADRAGAEAFFDALWTAEAKCYANQRLVRAYYYIDPSPTGTVKWGHDYLTDGSAARTSTGTLLSATNSTVVSLEQALVMRARCGETSKGKPRYVMKYFHGQRVQAPAPDNVALETIATQQSTAAAFTNGTLPGGAVLCRPDGLHCDTPVFRPFITTRTLKRRGKRPPA